MSCAINKLIQLGHNENGDRVRQMVVVLDSSTRIVLDDSSQYINADENNRKTRSQGLTDANTIR